MIDKKRLIIYVSISFGIAWLAGLVIFLTGGLVNSPVLVPGTTITLALLLLSFVYMWAPALGNIFTRLITRQEWTDLLLRMQIKSCWKPILAAWFLPGILTIIGGAVYFLIFPGHFDLEMPVLKEMLKSSGLTANVDPITILIGQLIQAMLIAPIINSFFTFGEEFGWRGYLQPILMPLGERKAMVLTGIVWGLWHAPVIAMGHNYGLDYPGFPWAGILAMVWFCVLVGIILGWLSLRAKNIWPAIIGHAAINGIAGLPILLSTGEPNPLLGPLPVGVIGSIALLACAAWMFLKSRSDTPENIQ